MIKGAAHITGGGLVDNPPRMLPQGLAARIDWRAWTRPSVFTWLQEAGDVAEEEMRRTFNCGVGMVACVAVEHAEHVLEALSQANQEAFICGDLIAVEGD